MSSNQSIAIDPTWLQSEANRLGFDDAQMDTLLHIAAAAWLFAARTTYDELAAFLKGKPVDRRAAELKRMSAIIPDAERPNLAMRREPCLGQSWWHVYHKDEPHEFFCHKHLPEGRRGAVKYDGVEPCQGTNVIIERVV